jgi:antitoxin component HigA of HigAB toxin-antitoxin module
MKPIIETADENGVALAFVARLIDGDPEKDSKQGQLLSLLAEQIQIFEKRYETAPRP